MEITLIRHGATRGNIERRYIGRTDEELCKEGEEALRQMAAAGKYPSCSDARVVFSSPMRRCVQSAKIIFPDIETSKIVKIDDLREMDFGSFEGKTYDELKADESYSRWLESGGKEGAPGGESVESFARRCVFGFFKMIEMARESLAERVVAFVHGGVIMAVMSFLTGGEYYSFQVKNGEGFSFIVGGDSLEARLQKEKIDISNVSKIES